jgi:hypothetical protein
MAASLLLTYVASLTFVLSLSAPLVMRSHPHSRPPTPSRSAFSFTLLPPHLPNSAQRALTMASAGISHVKCIGCSAFRSAQRKRITHNAWSSQGGSSHSKPRQPTECKTSRTASTMHAWGS